MKVGEINLLPLTRNFSIVTIKKELQNRDNLFELYIDCCYIVGGKELNLLKSPKQRAIFILVILAIVAVSAVIIVVTAMENTKKEAHIANALQIISAAKSAENLGWEITEEGIDAYEKLNIGDMTDPWENEKYVVARVYKNAGGYGVELKSKGGQCDLDDMENLILTYDTRMCDEKRR